MFSPCSGHFKVRPVESFEQQQLDMTVQYSAVQYSTVYEACTTCLDRTKEGSGFEKKNCATAEREIPNENETVKEFALME